MKQYKKNKLVLLASLLLTSSCSFFGVQNEEGPSYKVLVKEGDFEIREYAPYIVAETTVKGNFNDSSGDAFRILASYIFGKNEGNKKVSMTSPVEMKQSSIKIAMISPVEMSQSANSYTMRFSMPSKYSLEDLPKPLDARIKFKKMDQKVLASHQFSWTSSQKKNDKKAQGLRKWLRKQENYTALENYSYAGYNPPWTIPFLRRNEIHIELLKKQEIK
jgi:hypothetical protein